LNYDGAPIELLDVAPTPLTADYAWTYAITSTPTFSQARIAAAAGASPPTLYGRGSLFWLTFRVAGPLGAESPLDLKDLVAGMGGTSIYTPDDLLNPILLQLQDGVFHAVNGYRLGDLNGDGVIQAVDAYVVLQIASGKLTPVDDQWAAGDVNGDGQVDAADATMILYYAVHGTWLPPSATAAGVGAQSSAPVVLSLDDVQGAPGQVVETSLRAENLADWAGGEIVMVYDTSVVAGITGVRTAGLTSNFTLRYHDEGAGLLRIALAGQTPISGSGALATLSLHIAPTASGYSRTPLSLAEAHLNDISGRDLAASALHTSVMRHPGQLQVGSRAYLPSVLNWGD
jgi:hypothetical protein